MNESQQIKDVLTEIGYDLRDFGKEYRARPIYRDSDNHTVLRIKKDTGRWTDFKEGISGSFEELVRLSLNLASVEDAKKFLKNKVDFSERKVEKPQITEVKTLSKEFLNKLIKNNFYWNERGVSDDTLRIFEGGVCQAGKMTGRYVFPILDHRNRLVGVSGRDIYDNSYSNRPKWKHIGNKYSWKYPMQVNADILHKKKEVIIVESIGDMLSLWEAGVDNTMVTFGLDISSAMLNALLRLDPNRVIVSFNNDEDGNSAGNKAAQKAKKKLLSHFDDRQIKISLPTKKDFGEMNKEEVHSWVGKI